MTRTSHPILRPTASTALASLHMDRGTAVLIAATMALALGALLPVTALMGPSGRRLEPQLEISTVRGGDLGLPWNDPRTPEKTQRQATIVLFGLLTGMAAAGLGTAAITIVALVGARDAVRTPDNAVRRGVGASRRTLRNAALLEAAVIATSASILGTALGATLSRLAIAEWPGKVSPFRAAPSLALVVTLAMVVVVSSLLPLIFARQGGIVNAEPAPRQIFGPAVGQFAASLAVLVTGALVARYATSVDGVLAGGNDATVLELTGTGVHPAELGERYAIILDRLRAASVTVSLTSPGAITGLGTIAFVTTDCGNCSEGGLPLRFHVFSATHQFVSPDSFQALGIRLIAGRGLLPTDRSSTMRVAVVNRMLAQRHFQRGEAVGRQMLVGDDKVWYTVVGIVEDPPARGLGSRFQPPFTVYLSILQHPASAADLLLQANGNNFSAAQARATVTAALAPRNTRILETRVSQLHAREAAPVAWFARWITVEGWVTLLMAVVGMFAVMRIWVRSLRPELGVRRAVGARRARVLLLVLRQAGVVAVTGVLAGLWFGWAVWAVLPTILRGAATWDSNAVIGAALPLVLATLAGVLMPAVRSVRENPAALLESTE